MADPVTAGIGIASSAAGGILGGIGAKQSADASAAAYRYKAAVALRNQQINLQNSQWALDAGDTKALISGMKSRQDIAGTKAMQAASGLDVTTGSAVSVRDSQTEVAQFDQNTIRWEAKKVAYGYQTRAAAEGAEAQSDVSAAENAEKAGRLGMLASFISGAGGVASKWLQGSKAGAFNTEQA